MIPRIGFGLCLNNVTVKSDYVKIDSNDTKDPSISLSCFHLSCRSSKPSEWANNELGGVLFYDLYEDPKLSLKIKPGYIFICSKKDLPTGNKGQIHGDLFYKLTGKKIEDTNVLCEGFARKIGMPWTFNSSTMNAPGNNNYQDDNRRMNSKMEGLLQKCLYKWEYDNHGQNIYTKNIA